MSIDPQQIKSAVNKTNYNLILLDIGVIRLTDNLLPAIFLFLYRYHRNYKLANQTEHSCGNAAVGAEKITNARNCLSKGNSERDRAAYRGQTIYTYLCIAPQRRHEPNRLGLTSPKQYNLPKTAFTSNRYLFRYKIRFNGRRQCCHSRTHTQIHRSKRHNQRLHR